MAVKLKPGCWYECERDDWREVAVCGFAGVVEDGEGPVIVRASSVPGSVLDLFKYDEEGDESGGLESVLWPVASSTQSWDEVAHAALVGRGWFTPWEVAS